VARADAEGRRDRLLAYLMARTRVDNGDYPCEPHPRGVTFEDKSGGYFATAVVEYQCKRTIAELKVDYQLFFDVDPRHQGFVRLSLPGQPPSEHVVRGQAHSLALSRPVSLVDHMLDYLLLGIEHIFTGYDHLAFLFGLLVVAGLVDLKRGLRYVLGVVTAFTVAHSITLIVAGLDLLRLPSRLVEPAIALSIAWVAVENLLVDRPRHRWLLTFGFGLVHGFGFASVLREIGLPPRGLVLSLVSFNVGVELGQLTVVALVAPALHLLAREPPAGWRLLWLVPLSALAVAGGWRFGLALPQLCAAAVGAPLLLALITPRLGYARAVRRGGSLVLAALALFWFFERVLARAWLGGALG